jgi:hypothetical protein
MIFKKRKYRLNNNDRIEELFLILFAFIFFSYSFGICTLGAFLNIGVIVGNDGRMPVLSECEFSTDRHFSFQEKEEIHYYYLADIIKLKTSFSDKFAMVSIGDVFIFFAFLLMFFSVIFFTIKINKFNKRIKKKYG